MSFFKSGPVFAAFLSIVAGAVYLMAALPYAKACHAAPTVHSGFTILELAFFIPAVAFSIAGVIGLIAGTFFLIVQVNDRS